jgi:hypothetical protein
MKTPQIMLGNNSHGGSIIKRGVLALIEFNLTSFLAYFTRDQVSLFPQFYLILPTVIIYLYTINYGNPIFLPTFDVPSLRV